MRFYDSQKRDNPGDYFPLPKSIFTLDLSAGEIAVYAYLMYCEDRKTFQCHPSYNTIGDAIGMCKNTVKKYVESLERKGFIFTQPTTVITKDGRAHNGSLKYTIQPIKPIEEAHFERKIAIANAQLQSRLALEKYDKKHGRR